MSYLLYAVILLLLGLNMADKHRNKKLIDEYMKWESEYWIPAMG